MTTTNILNICYTNQFILLRLSSKGFLVGFNCNIVHVEAYHCYINSKLDQESVWASYLPCSFSEYLTNKPKNTFLNAQKKINEFNHH